MVWVVKLEQVIGGKVVSRKKVMVIEKPEKLERLEDLGLCLEEGKALLAQLQTLLVSQQVERDQVTRTPCAECGHCRHIKDYRLRRFDTVFGRVTVRRARLMCKNQACRAGTERTLPELRGRSTPEFDALRAKFSALLPYRVARRQLCELLPVSTGVALTTLRNRTDVVADQLARQLAEQPSSATIPSSSALTLGLDTAYIRAVPGYSSRHLPVLVGEVSGADGTPRYFAGVEQASKRHAALIRSQLDYLGYQDHNPLTVLSDGEDALQGFARQAASGPTTAILEWFHIAIRVHHLQQAARGLSTRVPTHAAAAAKIQAELERLHWRLWHGRTDAVDVSLQRLKTSIRAFSKYLRKRPWYDASRKVGVMLYDLKRYVRGHTHRIVNYHRRRLAGQRVSTALVESAVNHLVNRRMNKCQQMRWSAHGAHQVLQVRAALLNKEFETLLRRPSQNAGEIEEETLQQAA
jgi:hypothetical protein